MDSNQELAAAGQACINLTPAIRQAIATLSPGEVLKVFNDDPAAREGVPAWCRLTGNTLLEVKELSATETIFYIQKKKI